MKAKFLWEIFKKYRPKLFLLFFAYFLGGNVLPVYVMPYLLSIFGNQYQLGTLTTTGAISLAALYALLFCSEYLAGMAVLNRLKYQAIFKIENDLRGKLFSYSIRHSMDYYNNRMAGTIASSIHRIAYNIEGIIGNINDALCGCIIFIMAIFVYLKINPFLSLFFLVWTTLYFIISYYLTKLNYITSYKCSTEKNKASGMITDSFANIMNVKLFSKLERETRCIKKQSIEILGKESRVFWVKTLSNISMFLMMSLLSFVVIGYSFTMVLDKKMMIGTFLFVCQNIILMSGMIRSIYNKITEMVSKISDMNEGLDRLLTPVEVDDRKDAGELKDIEGKIVFKNVDFNYKKIDKTKKFITMS